MRRRRTGRSRCAFGSGAFCVNTVLRLSQTPGSRRDAITVSRMGCDRSGLSPGAVIRCGIRSCRVPHAAAAGRLGVIGRSAAICLASIGARPAPTWRPIGGYGYDALTPGAGGAGELTVSPGTIDGDRSATPEGAVQELPPGRWLRNRRRGGEKC